MIAVLFSLAHGSETPAEARANNLTGSEVIGTPLKPAKDQCWQWFCASLSRVSRFFQVQHSTFTVERG